ncbi:MAG: hypothetical protein E6987_00345 [Peptoniphilus harei]|nr:hypothetical protein [Peptoniphilus harei]
MNQMNDFEYLLNEIFGEPEPGDPNLDRVHELIDHMEESDIGSLDKISQNTNRVYFKAYRYTPKKVIVPYTKAFKNLGWTLYIRW